MPHDNFSDDSSDTENHYSSFRPGPNHQNRMIHPIKLIPTAGKSYEPLLAEILSQETVGHFSLNGKDLRLVRDYSNARWLNEERMLEAIEMDLIQGFEKYEPRDQNFNRIDPLLNWCLKTARQEGETNLAKITQGADIITDRTTLTKLVMLRYEPTRFGQQWHCCRLGKTVFMCPYRIDEEASYYGTYEQTMLSYEREKLRDLVTIGVDRQHINRPTDGNVVFQHVNSVTIDGIDSYDEPLKLLYSGQVDILDGREEMKPMEIRIQTRQLGLGFNWRTKAMKWYFQSVFSGADEFLVGIRPDKDVKHVSEFKRFKAERIRTEAEDVERRWWSRKECFGFLHMLLKKIRHEMLRLDEREGLIVTVKPNGTEIEFERAQEGFLENSFLKVFGKGNKSQ